jgi:hypothetical protein
MKAANADADPGPGRGGGGTWRCCLSARRSVLAPASRYPGTAKRPTLTGNRTGTRPVCRFRRQQNDASHRMRHDLDHHVNSSARSSRRTPPGRGPSRGRVPDQRRWTAAVTGRRHRVRRPADPAKGAARSSWPRSSDRRGSDRGQGSLGPAWHLRLASGPGVAGKRARLA